MILANSLLVSCLLWLVRLFPGTPEFPLSPPLLNRFPCIRNRRIGRRGHEIEKYGKKRKSRK
jgi:hypothetical protein